MNNAKKKRGARLWCGALVRCCACLMLAWRIAISTYAQEEEIESKVMKRSRPYEAFIASSAAKYGVDPFLLRIIGYLETRFTTSAVSKRGARGMMQFMPATASRYGLRNPHHPQAAIDAAARYLRDLSVRFDHRADLVLAAYNAGEGAVERFKGIPPYRETQNYVSRILAIAGR